MKSSKASIESGLESIKMNIHIIQMKFKYIPNSMLHIWPDKI